MVRRLNRFAAEVESDGQLALAHVPNSGRLGELLYPGAPVLLAPRTGPRKTAFDLLLARQGEQLACIDARLPGLLLEEALLAGQLPDLGPFTAVHREVAYGSSRLDLLGEGAGGLCYIECKSVTLVREGVALFPDAPTLRGVRHLEELQHAAHSGHRAAIVFVIQREDAQSLRPYAENDPAFAAALHRAAATVQVLAYACRVTGEEIAIARRVPVDLSA